MIQAQYSSPPDIKLALFYGGSIIEVMVNSNTTQLVADEEQFPLGEIPNSYDDEDQWEIFWDCFDGWITPSNDVEREIFMKAYKEAYETSKTQGRMWRGSPDIDQWDNAFADAARRIFARRSIKPCGDEGWAGNTMLMTTQPITFKGRNKIVGMYEFEHKYEMEDEDLNRLTHLLNTKVQDEDYDTSDDEDYDTSDNAVCTRVIYSNGGSISLGDEFRPARDWTG